MYVFSSFIYLIFTKALQTASVKESEKSKEFRKLKNEHHKLSIRANNFDDIEDTIHSLEEENSKLQDILVHHKVRISLFYQHAN